MQPDYFANHAQKLRFPWTLYHAPIVSALGDAIGAPGVRDVLNVGSGPFLELSRLPIAGRRITICDIDARAIDEAKRLHGSALARADVIVPDAPLPYGDASFDLVAAMDVIEHVAPPEPWLADLWRVVRPGGALFLTTPNYGSFSLRAIEATALEAIARVKGFTRRGIHPTKFDRARLAETLARLEPNAVSVRSISMGWVLVALARRG